MNARVLFLKDREMSTWWAGIAHDDRFSKMLVYAGAEFIESLPDTSMIDGARKFIEIVQTLADNPESMQEFPKPGLIHTVDKPPEKPKTS